MRFRSLTLLSLVSLLAFQSPSFLAAAPQSGATSPRSRQLFDFDWRFKAGDHTGAQASSFDDASWEKIDLPHDYMIEGKGQNIVQPGGRAGTGRASTLPTEPEGPFDPRSPGGNSSMTETSRSA